MVLHNTGELFRSSWQFVMYLSVKLKLLAVHCAISSAVSFVLTNKNVQRTSVTQACQAKRIAQLPRTYEIIKNP